MTPDRAIYLLRRSRDDYYILEELEGLARMQIVEHEGRDPTIFIFLSPGLRDLLDSAGLLPWA